MSRNWTIDERKPTRDRKRQPSRKAATMARQQQRQRKQWEQVI